MNFDKYGVAFASTDDLCELLYQNPEIDLSKIFVDDPDKYNLSIYELYADFEKLQKYDSSDIDIETFDSNQQKIWFMPEEYKTLDIAKWVLDQCNTQVELQRVGEELLLYQERNLFDLLRWTKYFVDTMRANDVVWGVGRGSSVASYVLYLIGIHKINSIYYDLNIDEFLK